MAWARALALLTIQSSGVSEWSKLANRTDRRIEADDTSTVLINFVISLARK